MASEFQHKDPNHLNPTQARKYVQALGVTSQQIEEAEKSGNPMPGVEFRDGKPRPFTVFHREDLEKWAENL